MVKSKGKNDKIIALHETNQKIIPLIVCQLSKWKRMNKHDSSSFALLGGVQGDESCFL